MDLQWGICLSKPALLLTYHQTDIRHGPSTGGLSPEDSSNRQVDSNQASTTEEAVLEQSQDRGCHPLATLPPTVVEYLPVEALTQKGWAPSSPVGPVRSHTLC